MSDWCRIDSRLVYLTGPCSYEIYVVISVNIIHPVVDIVPYKMYYIYVIEKIRMWAMRAITSSIINLLFKSFCVHFLSEIGGKLLGRKRHNIYRLVIQFSMGLYLLLLNLIVCFVAVICRYCTYYILITCLLITCLLNLLYF